ncbi:hypothetical protein [Halostagnicola kamekurae]|nr:hypothetical protein [Halostagnicola kamekurae]
MEEVERLNDIYTRVFDRDTPETVKDARHQARQVLDRTADDYWKLINEDRSEQYTAKVQTAKSEADDARNLLRTELNEIQTAWRDDIRAARRIQTLMPDSRESSQLLNDIEEFVDNRMWDDSADINSLQGEWQGLEKKWDDGVVSWDELQDRYALSDATIDRLKRLAQGEKVSFSKLDGGVVEELMNVDEFRDVLEVTL